MAMSIRDQILKVLVKPTTVTEVKNKLPKIKSFGTVAYHLKELEKEGIITKVKQEKEQGRPTSYQVREKKILDAFKEIEKTEESIRISLLKLLKRTPSISDDEAIDIIAQESKIDPEIIGDVLTDMDYQGLAEICWKILPKGERYLKNKSNG